MGGGERPPPTCHTRVCPGSPPDRCQRIEGGTCTFFVPLPSLTLKRFATRTGPLAPRSPGLPEGPGFETRQHLTARVS